MFVSRLMSAAALAFSISVLPVGAGAAEAGQCRLGGDYHVTSVAPYQVIDVAGYGYQPTLRGARVYVDAQPGLTREWLQRTVETQIASGQCDFGTPKTSVDVMSAGGSFAVFLTGADERAACEILHHAQQLFPEAQHPPR